VRPAIASHSVAYQARSHLIRMQNISLLGVFAAGAGLGYLIHEQVSTNWKSWSVAVGLIVSVGVGILTNILSTALAKRFPRDEP